LVVTTTGYYDPAPGLCERFGATYLGRLNPHQMVYEMSRSLGMFYRNVHPETFGVTTAIARRLGLRLDIECVGHDACGLAESREPQDLSERATMQRWAEILT
jgi:hypothetical protein